MKKKPTKKVPPLVTQIVSPAVRHSPQEAQDTAFAEIVSLIEQFRIQASQAVNTVLIDLYWKVGGYVWFKIQNEGWGKGTVLALASFVQSKRPGIRGFSAQNIWRMRQFFDAYRDLPDLSTLLRDLPWSSNLHIISRAKPCPPLREKWPAPTGLESITTVDPGRCPGLAWGCPVGAAAEAAP